MSIQLACFSRRGCDDDAAPVRTVPRNKQPRISFFASHVPKWAEHAEALGLDPQQVASMQARVDEAREAFRAQQLAQQQAQNSTQALRSAMEAMNREGAGLLKQIRGKSATLGPQAYTLASISPPEKPSPIGEPGTPYKFSVGLTDLGTLILRWKCDHPRGARGTTYQVSRQLEHGDGSREPEFKMLGLAGRKRFEDATLPPGVRGAVYRVQAIRSTACGMTATHSVSFGFADHGLPVPGRLQLAA